MSYDIYLMINTGIEEAEVKYVGNITYNIAPMVKKACGMTFLDMEGKIATEVAQILKKGMVAMIERPEEFEALNPDNGWGNFEDLLSYMKLFWSLCRKHPSCVVEVG
jgi:hypothetical protein